MQSWKGDRVSLRCLLFCFFGGIGCLIPYLPLHMERVGLTPNQSYIVSIVAPLVAALGPLFVCPLADRIGEAGGRSLRLLLGAVIILSAIIYPLLMCIPAVVKTRVEEPAISFTCDANRANILQKCCNEECYDWSEVNQVVFRLSDCKFACGPEQTYLTGGESTTLETGNPDDHDENPSEVNLDGTNAGPVKKHEIELNYEDNNNDEEGGDDQENEGEDEATEDEEEEEEEEEDEDEDEDEIYDQTERRKRDLMLPNNETTLHICFNEDSNTKCHVFTKQNDALLLSSDSLKITRTSENCDSSCLYSVNSDISCRIPDDARFLSCRVRCELSPLDFFDSNVLNESICADTEDNSQVTFWTYLLVRSIADIFPTTAVGLLDAAIIIATRETNIGRGDVGRELAFGSLGIAVFAPFVGVLNTFIPHDIPYVFSFVLYVLLMVISMLILLFAHSMPLSRPEWWSRHARVMPLGGVNRHLSELICFVCILVVLGFLWSGIDSYLPLYLSALGGSDYLLGLTLTIGCLPAILVLWNSERVIEYCGHTNLLIIAFIFYIVRYTAYSYIYSVWWTLISEALEVFTMSILWVTVLLYMRQLVPRHLTITSQGMAVFFHFCLGRCLGAVFAALICTYTDGKNSMALVRVYQVGAVIAAIVASLYFTIYHCCLKCFCQPEARQTPQDRQEVLQGPTSNGTYTPLRVYHNGNEQKDQINY